MSAGKKVKTLFSLLFLCSGILFLPRPLPGESFSETVAESELILKRMTLVLQPPLWAMEYERVDQLLLIEMEQHPWVQGVVLRDSLGLLKAKRRNDQGDIQNFDPEKEELSILQDFRPMESRICMEEEVIGWLKLYIQEDYPHKRWDRDELGHLLSERLAAILAFPAWELFYQQIVDILECEMQNRYVFAIVIDCEGYPFLGIYKARGIGFFPFNPADPPDYDFSKKLSRCHLFEKEIFMEEISLGTIKIYLERM